MLCPGGVQTELALSGSLMTSPHPTGRMQREGLGCVCRAGACPPASLSPLQLGANALLFLGVNVYGLCARLLAQRSQRRAFLQARTCIEDRLRLEDENEKQVGVPGPGGPLGPSASKRRLSRFRTLGRCPRGSHLGLHSRALHSETTSEVAHVPRGHWQALSVGPSEP